MTLTQIAGMLGISALVNFLHHALFIKPAQAKINGKQELSDAKLATLNAKVSGGIDTGGAALVAKLPQ